VLLAGAAISGALAPRLAGADALVVVDVVAVADGYRASKLRGATVVNSKNEKIGELDDLIVNKDRVLFGIIEVGGFLGLGSRLIAVPYSSLQISDGGRRIVLPGATKEQLKALPEFKYR
jgi:sporulation protein YlmC with PRC-barrel domain